jgi:DNA-binding response OmpR family regulator
MLEDEPIVALGLEDMLLDFGFKDVRVSTTIEQAFCHLEDRAPDIAILDVNIRGERSYGVADALARLGVPFLFATGYGDAEHPQALRSVLTLTKPYSAEELESALVAAIAKT